MPYPTLTSHPRLTRQLSPSQWWRSRVRIYLHKLGHLLEIFEHQSNHATAMFSALFLSLTDNRIQHFELLIKQYNILFLFLVSRSLAVVESQNTQKTFPYVVQTPNQVVINFFLQPGLTLVAEWVRVPVVSKPEASLPMICVRRLDRLSLPGRDGMSCHSGGVPPPCCCDRYHHHHHLLHHHVRNCHLGGRQEAEW